MTTKTASPILRWRTPGCVRNSARRRPLLPSSEETAFQVPQRQRLVAGGVAGLLAVARKAEVECIGKRRSDARLRLWARQKAVEPPLYPRSCTQGQGHMPPLECRKAHRGPASGAYGACCGDMKRAGAPARSRSPAVLPPLLSQAETRRSTATGSSCCQARARCSRAPSRCADARQAYTILHCVVSGFSALDVLLHEAPT